MEALRRLANTASAELSPFELDGTNEHYYRATIRQGSVELEVYVYADSAGYFKNGRWVPFEKYDYATSGELVRALVSSIEKAFRTAGT